MPRRFAREAAIPNPALVAFQPLIGEWTTVGHHPMRPGITLHGRASFGWVDGGAFLMMRTDVVEPQIPSGITIIGSDDASSDCFMLYFDERGVSRKYTMSFGDTSFRWWRDAPDLSQRFNVALSEDGRTMIGDGQLSRDGVSWEGDLELTYTRSA